MDAAVDTYGRLDCAVNNAGREAVAGVVDSSEEDFDAEVAVNAKGVFLCLRHEIRHMRQGGGGAIVNTSSVSGLRPTRAQAVYGMTKAAVTYLTRTAAAARARARTCSGYARVNFSAATISRIGMTNSSVAG